MKARRKTVPALDLPPRKRFFWKTLENQRAAVAAKTALITDATNITKVANGDAERQAVSTT